MERLIAQSDKITHKIYYLIVYLRCHRRSPARMETRFDRRKPELCNNAEFDRV